MAAPRVMKQDILNACEGMVIPRAGSLAEARQIAAADPMHSSGARTFTVRPWLLNEGTVTVKVTYSNGGREVA